MPKATLTYDLDDEQEKDHFRYASTALDVRLAVGDYDDWLRNTIKWAPDDVSESAANAFQEARDKLYEVFDDHGVDWEVY